MTTSEKNFKQSAPWIQGRLFDQKRPLSIPWPQPKERPYLTPAIRADPRLHGNDDGEEAEWDDEGAN